MNLELLQNKLNKRLKKKHKCYQDRKELGILFLPEVGKGHRHDGDKPMFSRTQPHPRSTPMVGQIK